LCSYAALKIKAQRKRRRPAMRAKRVWAATIITGVVAVIIRVYPRGKLNWETFLFAI